MNFQDMIVGQNEMIAELRGHVARIAAERDKARAEGEKLIVELGNVRRANDDLRSEVETLRKDRKERGDQAAASRAEAERLREERDEARDLKTTWKATAEQAGQTIVSMCKHMDTIRKERDEALAGIRPLSTPVASAAPLRPCEGRVTVVTLDAVLHSLPRGGTVTFTRP